MPQPQSRTSAKDKAGVIVKKAAPTTRRVAKKASGAFKESVRGRGSSNAVPAVVAEAWKGVSTAAREEFERTVSTEPTETLDPALWGPEPTSEEVRDAAFGNLRLLYAARRAVLEQSVTRPQAAELLGVSQQAILDRLDAGALIGLKDGREWRLPMWQFHPDNERGILPGLAELKKAFSNGVVSLSRWATTENADLGGSTPAQRLAAGDTAAVLTAAAATTSAAW